MGINGRKYGSSGVPFRFFIITPLSAPTATARKESRTAAFLAEKDQSSFKEMISFIGERPKHILTVFVASTTASSPYTNEAFALTTI